MIFSCGHADSRFLITYSVAGEQKTYKVCQECSREEPFQKFIIEKKEIKN